MCCHSVSFCGTMLLRLCVLVISQYMLFSIALGIWKLLSDCGCARLSLAPCVCKCLLICAILCASACLSIWHLWFACAWLMPSASCSQESFRLLRRHWALAKPMVPAIPKLHQCWHMVERQTELGAWRASATWFDEGLNRVLRDAAKGAHQMCFESSVLWRMQRLLSRD